MIKLYVRRGSRQGDETYYLHIPREFVRALGMTPDDKFELTVDMKNGLTLCYKKVERGTAAPVGVVSGIER